MSKKVNKNGCVVYDGPSRWDGERIVVILTGLTDNSTNVKTGKMLQLYILRADCKPIEARQRGLDCSICGDCPHRSGSCYVNLGQGPRAVWECWSTGKGYADYDPETHDPMIEGRVVRLGAYGDPAMVPIEALLPVLRLAAGHTGYTHQWEKSIGADWREWCMASVDTEDQAIVAKYSGWRYFLASTDHVKQPGELNCPASEEMGKRTTCERCQLCAGSSKPKCPNVFIEIHGTKAHKATYRKRTLVQIG
jgi:hypothetical protein